MEEVKHGFKSKTAIIFTFLITLPSATISIQPSLKSRLSHFTHIDKKQSLKLDNGLALTPQMGWNSWNYFRCDIDEKTIREIADAIVSTGLRDAGYNYVNIDDCWANRLRDEEGYLVARNTTFPSGIKSLADYVHSKGLKFGIYSDAGYFTCAHQPGSLGFEEKDAETFAEWGVDYLKYDNCYNDGTPPFGRYQKMSQALNATGRPILFSMCDWGVDHPSLWGQQIGNSWRTTGDIQDSWESMMEIAAINNEWYEAAAPGGWNDPDMLEVGNGGMSESEYRVHFSLWAIMKAPLLVGCDVRRLSEESKYILTNPEVLAVNQDPLGVQGHRVRHVDFIDIWTGLLSGNRMILAIVNRKPNTTELVTVIWPWLLLEEGTAVQARDLWKHEDLKEIYVGNFTAKVPPHDILMLVLTPLNGTLSQ